MCRIRFEIETATKVATAKGRYRKVGASSWSEFSVNLGNPQTPDIKEIGEYELEIKVNGGAWQGREQFSVSENCSNDDGQQNGKPDPKTDPDQQPHTPQDGHNTHDPDEDLGGGDNDDNNGGGKNRNFPNLVFSRFICNGSNPPTIVVKDLNRVGGIILNFMMQVDGLKPLDSEGYEYEIVGYSCSDCRIGLDTNKGKYSIDVPKSTC